MGRGGNSDFCVLGGTGGQGGAAHSETLKSVVCGGSPAVTAPPLPPPQQSSNGNYLLARSGRANPLAERGDSDHRGLGCSTAGTDQEMPFSELEEIWIFGNLEEIWMKFGFGKFGGFVFSPARNLCSEGDRRELVMLVSWKSPWCRREDSPAWIPVPFGEFVIQTQMV